MLVLIVSPKWPHAETRVQSRIQINYRRNSQTLKNINTCQNSHTHSKFTLIKGTFDWLVQLDQIDQTNVTSHCKNQFLAGTVSDFKMRCLSSNTNKGLVTVLIFLDSFLKLNKLKDWEKGTLNWLIAVQFPLYCIWCIIKFVYCGKTPMMNLTWDQFFLQTMLYLAYISKMLLEFTRLPKLFMK